MKLSLQLVAALFLIVATVACKKEKQPASPSAISTDTPTCRISIIETRYNHGYTDTTLFTYNSDGQLSSSRSNYTDGFSKRTFQHFNNLIVVTTTNSRDSGINVDSVFLNPHGLIESRHWARTAYNYTYDAAGQLTKLFVIGSWVANPVGESFYYQWQDGNLSQYYLDTTTNTPYRKNVVNTYYSNYYTPFASLLNSPEFFSLGAHAIKGDYLLKSNSTTDLSGTTVYNITYEFDTDGRPVGINYNNGEIFKRIYYNCQ